MATVTFTLTDGWSSPTGSVEVAFEPRNVPWLNADGKIVATPQPRDPQSYALGVASSVNLDPGPWRMKVGARRFAFTVPAGGGPLWPMIGLQAGLPSSTPEEVVSAAVAAWIDGQAGAAIADMVTDALDDADVLTKVVADANYAPVVGQVVTLEDGGEAIVTGVS